MATAWAELTGTGWSNSLVQVAARITCWNKKHTVAPCAREPTDEHGQVADADRDLAGFDSAPPARRSLDSRAGQLAFTTRAERGC